MSYANDITQSQFDEPLDIAFTRGNADALLQPRGGPPSRDSITMFLESAK